MKLINALKNCCERLAKKVHPLSKVNEITNEKEGGITQKKSLECSQVSVGFDIKNFIPKKDKNWKSIYVHVKQPLYEKISQLAQENNLTGGQVIILIIEHCLATDLKNE